MRFVIIFFFFCPFLTLSGKETLILATTTSTYESGLLDYLLRSFESETGISVKVIPVGTGKALKLGETGDVDAVLVHAKDAEMNFVRNGFGIERKEFMYNDFLLLGPDNDPAKIKGMKNCAAAMKKIKEHGAVFISRGDESGTHLKEKELWELAGGMPLKNNRYIETGQGMTGTLTIADEKNGYILIDRGTYLLRKNHLRLQIVLEGDKALLNPYGIIAVNPAKNGNVKYKSAKKLIDWITSPDGLKMIADFRINGGQVFFLYDK